MVSYDLLLFMLKIETSTHAIPYFPAGIICVPLTSGMICGSGSFAVQFGDHFQSGDHLRSGIICGAVQIRSLLTELPLFCFPLLS